MMKDYPTLRDQIGNWCRHFNGVQNDTCRAGVPYDSVRVQEKRLPCFKNQGCSHLCASASFRTSAELDVEVARQEAAAAAFLTELAEGKTCPHCHTPIESREQVGRCVYSYPCGCRHQGTLPKER